MGSRKLGNAPPSKPGTPSKYTPTTVAIILEAIERGLSQRQAAALAGVSPASLTRYKTHPEFLAGMETARAKFAAAHVGNIDRIAKDPQRGDWRASAWILAKRIPGEYGDTSTVHNITEFRERRAVCLEVADAAGLLSQALATMRNVAGNKGRIGRGGDVSAVDLSGGVDAGDV